VKHRDSLHYLAPPAPAGKAPCWIALRRAGSDE